jgi:hypothetical protein
MNQRKSENERDDTELEEELKNVRDLHPEWAGEKAGDNAEGAGPEPAGE